MEIKSLKDLKNALSEIPDDVLDYFGISVDPEGDGVSLLCWNTENDPVQTFAEMQEKYPVFFDIQNWFKAIVNLQEKYSKSSGDELYEEMVSSSDKF